MHFGIYLHRTGIITAEQLVAAPDAVGSPCANRPTGP